MGLFYPMDGQEREENIAFRQMCAVRQTRPEEHARLCAHRINLFWRRRGYDAQAWIDHEPGRHHDTSIYPIRSTMVGGFPVKAGGKYGKD